MTATPVSAPTITSIAFDKSAYNVGDLVTATITYVAGKSSSAPAPSSVSFTGTALDSVTNQSGTLTVNFVVDTTPVTSTDPSAVTVTDSATHTWTKISDTGSVAKFTTTA